MTRYDKVRLAAWCGMGVVIGAFWTGIVLAMLWWRGIIG